ncbi:DNA-binding protein [Bacillus cereus]|uniref:HU family DNA-binding protein n=1 Tax=Bacillus paranthracis TaxID=2026186 RepID=UPI000BF99A07|nr:HU family DNA-binding protein [Bacillus paranthracis]NMW17001.1 DNA-binding protein [Bacillus paranthracis]PFN31369.1 DNA-binding protein [Bacillus cereus]RAT14360.1 DNA-binding protein [Bacillus cereus]
MNKSELIKQVAIQAELKKPQGSLAVDAVLESIQYALQNGGHVQLLGFGSFEVRKTPAFKAGKALKETVNTK